jgi:hypothetical protein
MTEKNEAAERLLREVTSDYHENERRAMIVEALAAERRATVERIRAAIDVERHDTADAAVEFFALERILDEEAAR